MAKPSLMDSLLGRPSQSYATAAPPEKRYFSYKAHLLRTAPALAESGEAHAAGADGETTIASNPDDLHDALLALLPSIVVAQQEDSDSDDSVDDNDIFYTPDSSPRASMAAPVHIQPTPPVGIPSTRTWPSSRSSSSVDSVSLDGNSIFSDDSSPSTAVTTPLASESGDSGTFRQPKYRSPQPRHDAQTQDAHWLNVPGAHESLRSTQTPKLGRSSTVSSATRPPRTKSSAGAHIPRSASTRSSSVSRSSSSGTRSRKNTRSIMMNMTALIEEDESTSRANENPLANVFETPLEARPRVISSPSSSSSSYGHYRHRSLPSATPYNPSIPSSGTPGYTSLTLPRAPPPAFAPAANTSSKRLSILGYNDAIDLTKSGIAQTTMASVEVVRGLVGGGRSMFHRKTAPKGDVLGFTSYRVPPSSVPSSGVLVQVWSVGVDRTDFRLASSESTGFVPGRSFVGRVLECGWEVKDEVARKGDWVVGLLDVRKSGALQEFIVADRHRVYRVPHPLLEENLSPDELALLPLCGVAAHRAVRTFAVAFGTSVVPTEDGAVRRFTNDHEPGKTKRRVLVLKGHDGVGAMAVQMLAKRGWRVCVHAPMPNVKDEDMYMRDIEDRVRAWGGEEVVFDDGEGRGAVVRVIERLVGDGDAFDAILDTVGGKEIWEASQKLLSGASDGKKKSKSRGQFTTLVGDASENIIPSAGSHFKAGLRALRNTHNQEGGGKVGYAWVSIAQDVDWEGEDVRDSVGAVMRLAVNDGIRPFVGGEDRFVPFERTPNVFSAATFQGGGTVVVKVVS